MKRAEMVTFGGGGLDRASEMRTNSAFLMDGWAADETRVMLAWEGKLLSVMDDLEPVPTKLAYLSPAAPLVADRFNDAVFLGRDADGRHYFAVELQGWTPADGTDADRESFLDQSLQTHPDLPTTYVFAELRAMMTQLSAFEAELATTARAVLAWHKSHRFCSNCGAPSTMVEAGWQRRCHSCNTSHFPRTDPVVIMLVIKGDKLLLGRSPHWPEGMYSLLAGFVEPGETLEAAVRREVHEETNVLVGEVRYLASQPWAFPMSLMFGCLGEALSTEIQIDPEEIEDALWVSKQDVMDVFAGTHPSIRQPRRGAIAEFLMRNWLSDTLE